MQFNRRALRRAGIDQSPEWVESFCFTGWSAQKIRETLPILLDEMSRKYGGIFAVIIDGTADMVTDVNGSEECAALISQLHALAIQHDCPILNVIHSNEGGKSDAAARGWLGKQMARKAESNLILEKVNEITTVWGEQMRGAPIFKQDGPRFAWSSALGMHISTQSKATVKGDEDRAELRELAEGIFASEATLSTGEIQEKIMKNERCSQRTAERRQRQMKQMGVIKYLGFGKYGLGDPVGQ